MCSWQNYWPHPIRSGFFLDTIQTIKVWSLQILIPTEIIHISLKRSESETSKDLSSTMLLFIRSEFSLSSKNNKSPCKKTPLQFLIPTEKFHFALIVTKTQTKYSRVLGMSRMALTPAQTTATGFRPSSMRSELTSRVTSAPRWTPPIPPVAIIGIPAICAIVTVPPTVVPPCSLCRTTVDMSLREHLIALFSSEELSPFAHLANFSRRLGLIPTCTFPSNIAIVAGTAPLKKYV